MSDPLPGLRLDKWLWHARLFKTRTLAARVVSEGKVRVNSVRVDKPSTTVRPGDGLTFAQGRTVRVVRVVALGARRGPAVEAQALYEDLTEPEPREKAPSAPSYDRGGRPTKRDRRLMENARPKGT